MVASRRSPAFLIPVLLFAVLTLAGLVVFVHGYRLSSVDGPWGMYLMKWGGGIFLVAGIPLLLPHKLRVNLTVSFVMVLLCTFVFNIYLAYTPPPAQALSSATDAKRLVTPGFDHRDRMQVVRDLRAKGVDAVPAFFGLHRLKDDQGPEDLMPLMGVSTATTVLCNEIGTFSIYNSDEHGFNNPQNMPDEVDVLLVGDSFMQGQCMPPGKDIAGLLRGRGYSVYTIGNSGAGALLELATLMEYGLRKQPKVVIWGYAGNDPSDTRAELLHPKLRRYLEEDGYSQNLVQRQPEIDAYWRDLLVRKKLLEPKPDAPKVWKAREPSIRDLVTLYALRRMLGLRRGSKGDWRGSYRKILTRGRTLIEAQGGKMYFIPFPYFNLVRDAPEQRRTIFDIVEPTGITMINVDTIFFEHPDKLAMFPLSLPGHFSEAGYALVTQGIIDQALTPAGITPRTRP